MGKLIVGIGIVLGLLLITGIFIYTQDVSTKTAITLISVEVVLGAVIFIIYLFNRNKAEVVEPLKNQQLKDTIKLAEEEMSIVGLCKDNIINYSWDTVTIESI